ncbi:hypothetical protein CR513_33006, partial [Mucuna pruriens]
MDTTRPLSLLYQQGYCILGSNCGDRRSTSSPSRVDQTYEGDIGNTTLKLDNTDESCRQDEEEGPEEEALVELERLLEKEGRPRLKTKASSIVKGICRCLRLVIPRHVGFGYHCRGAHATLTTRHNPSLIAAKKDEVGSDIENQRGGRKEVEHGLPDYSRILPMGGQYSTSPQER